MRGWRPRRRSPGERAVASYLEAVLAEIYLCASCSCHEILRSATARVVRGRIRTAMRRAQQAYLRTDELRSQLRRLQEGAAAASRAEQQAEAKLVQRIRACRSEQAHARAKMEAAAVSRSCACIGSPCLRQCGHGASIGGREEGRMVRARRRGAPAVGGAHLAAAVAAAGGGADGVARRRG
jgi:hypothetical protein